jgi:hypothetical protein
MKADVMDWKTGLFSLAGILRFAAFLSILMNAVHVYQNGKAVHATLIAFSVLQLFETCCRLPYMMQAGKAGYIQTMVFIVCFAVLVAVYSIAATQHGID